MDEDCEDTGNVTKSGKGEAGLTAKTVAFKTYSLVRL
jgi:hypothetical protein